MGKRKKVEKIQDNYPAEDLVIPAVILMIILLASWTWAMIVSQNGLQGSAYFFTAADLILILMVSLPYTLKSVIASLVYKRVEQRQYRNAKSILNAGLLISILYSIATILLLYIFADALCQSVLIGPKSYLTLVILSCTILFYSISCTFNGYFEGMGGSFPLLTTTLTGKLVMAVAAAIFSGIFMTRGIKAANVLGTQETRYAYGAAGAAIGVSIGAAAACVLMIFMYRLYGNYFRKLLKRDTVKRRTDTVDIVIQLVMQVLPMAGSYFVVLLYPVIDQIIFFRTGELHGETVMLTYQWGAYAGIYRGVLFLPLLIVLTLTATERRRLSIGYHSGDIHEVRIKIHGIIRDNMIISLFFMALTLVMADKIIAGFFLAESALAVRLLRMGCIAMVLLAMAVTLLVVLPAINMSFAALLTGILALAANGITAYITVNRLSMGIYGIMLSVIVFGIVYTLLGFIFLHQAVRGRMNIRKLLYFPLASSIITMVVMILLSLLFGLFLPPIVNVIVTALLSFLVYFIALAKFDVISAYSVSAFPFGSLMLKLGKLIGIFP